MQRAGNQQNTPAFLSIAGGALAVVGALLTWYDIEFQAAGSDTLKGTDISVGSGTLGVGVVVAIFGVILLTRAKTTGGKGSSITILVLSIFALFVGGYNVASPGDALAEFGASDVAENLGISESAASDAIQAAVDSGSMDVSTGVGSYVVLLGAIAGIAGGIMGIRAARSLRAAAAPAPAPAQPPPPPPQGPPS